MNPFVFLVNNNYDRGHTVDGSDFEQDDLGPVDIAKGNLVPDCQYITNGLPAIPCTRDLEDYFRLWTPGLSAALSALPTNYTVQLALYGDGAIRVFRAIESAGGTNYLFDTATASNQVANSASLYIGLLTNYVTLVLNNRTNEHFIFCGAQTGSAELQLQILDGNQNIVADSQAYLQINDIKQMYERWTVGDNANVPPTATAALAVNDMPTPPQPAFQYAAPQDTNTPYILHVHGYNMPTWAKDRFAETEYKRLYWQGYKGRFGEFRWPTTIQNFSTRLRAFDNSESNAWASAKGLTNLLTKLNAEYPGKVYLTAHSHGNVVAGEALLQAGNKQLVNTYIAMQAALPAHSYDATTPYRYSPRYPDFYAHYWTGSSPCYFNASAGAGTYVNFFNTNDWALDTLWELDQDVKPDSGYSYRISGNQTNFYSGTDAPFTILLPPADRYTIFSYCDPATCMALGAQANVGGAFLTGTNYNQVLLPSVWPPDNSTSDPSKKYGAHVWHSAEFRSDNPSRAGFWNAVLGPNGFNLK